VEPHRLEPRAAHLLATLEEAVQLLEDYDEPEWAATLRGIRPDDSVGLRRLLPGHGGPTDFHAVFLTTMDGHWIQPDEGRGVNERLSLLRAILYMDARALLQRA
jgi:hypothetical protein